MEEAQGTQRREAKDLVGHVKVLSHDGRLVLEHRELYGVADNVQLLVPKVEPVLLGDVTKEIHDSGVSGRKGKKKRQSMILNVYPWV